MESELLNPPVPVALIELCAVRGMSEQAWPLTDLRAEGLVEASEASRAKLLPGPGVPVVLGRGQFAQHGRPGLAGPGDGGDALAQLLPSPALLLRRGGPSTTSVQRSSCSKGIGGGAASIIAIPRSGSSIRTSSSRVS